MPLTPSEEPIAKRAMRLGKCHDPEIGDIGVIHVENKKKIPKKYLKEDWDTKSNDIKWDHGKGASKVYDIIEEYKGRSMDDIVEERGVSERTVKKHIKILLEKRYIIEEDSKYYVRPIRTLPDSPK